MTILRLMAVIASVAGYALAGEPEWPGFQGPNRDNKSFDMGLLKKWPEGGPPLAWSATGIGYKGFSSAAISGGFIYTAGVKPDKQEYVSALDMEGRLKWQRGIGPAFLQTNGGSRGTPTVSDGLLYHLGGLGRLVCLDAKTGDEKWSVDITKQFGGKSATWGWAESPLVDGDKVFVTPGRENIVVALNKRTGEIVWVAKGYASWAAMCSPMVIECGGLRQIVTMDAKYAIGIREDTGTLLWRYRHVTEGGNHITTPVYRDGALYCTSGYGGGGVRLDLTVKDDTAGVRVAWTDKTLDNHHGGVVLVDGFIYGSNYNGKWVCLDFETGKPRWVATGVGKGAVAYADGMLYCLSEDGVMALVQATPEKHDEVSRFKIPSGGIREYFARPVVFGGRLYVRHSDTLFAYDVAARPPQDSVRAGGREVTMILPEGPNDRQNGRPVDWEGAALRQRFAALQPALLRQQPPPAWVRPEACPKRSRAVDGSS